MSYQKVIIIGNLGSDPEMRYIPSGTAVTTLNVATKETIAKNDKPCPAGWKESYNGKNWELTTWFRVSVWGKRGESCNQYLKKGSQVQVEGKLKGTAVNGSQYPRIWTDGNGVPKASFELHALNVVFLGGRSEGGGAGAPQDQDEPPGYQEPSEEIPF